MKIFLIPCAILAFSVGTASAESGNPLRGQAYSQTMCSTCHSIDVSDASANPAAKPFREIDLAGKSGADLSKWLNTGHPVIQAPLISPAQAEDIEAYMAKIKAAKAG